MKAVERLWSRALIDEIDLRLVNLLIQLRIVPIATYREYFNNLQYIRTQKRLGQHFTVGKISPPKHYDRKRPQNTKPTKARNW